jgi:hypothetical protein
MLILLLIAFFVYRLINPSGAKSMLYDIKSFSNDKIGTHFALTGDVVELTWTLVDMTGDILEDTWTLQNSWDDLFLEDSLLLEETSQEDPVIDTQTGTDEQVPTTTTNTSTTNVVKPSKPTTTQPKSTTSSNELSNQDLRDLKNLLENFQ